MVGDVESDGDDSITSGTVCSEGPSRREGSNVLSPNPQVVIVDQAGFLVGPRDMATGLRPRCQKAGAVFTARTAMRINAMLGGDQAELAKVRHDVWRNAMCVPGLGNPVPPDTLMCLFNELFLLEVYL